VLHLQTHIPNLASHQPPNERDIAPPLARGNVRFRGLSVAVLEKTEQASDVRPDEQRVDFSPQVRQEGEGKEEEQ